VYLQEGNCIQQALGIRQQVQAWFHNIHLHVPQPQLVDSHRLRLEDLYAGGRTYCDLVQGQGVPCVSPSEL